MKPEYRVAVVLDETFGDKLFELSRTMHVWACDSVPNRRAAERLWADTPDYSLKSGVTTFQYDPQDVAESLFDVIELVEDHHSEYTDDGPWTILEVFGVFPNSDLISALEEDFGLRQIETTETGFVALKGSDDEV